ncbi:Zinc finger C2HC domain-containing protein 1A [Holothuria leucospilota]|uniref:Zinc finger C2HC domain-containing protein 1A n=1 Tax=Holothuria leucospilota TaxID=206669 RepID=A0A9Q0YDH0_HOLLE|nr:Zinc finger C2HC domain-containing protein 1A [Holothuria leucospilota]
MDDEEIPERLSSPPLLEPCPCCGRSFVHETLVKHQKICEKNASKQRKVFETSKKRLAGLGVDQLQVSKAPPPPSQKKNNWRRKHEEFQEAMKSARQVSHALKTGAPLPPPISQKPKVNPDYVQCPSCSRNFNETAAERHIPWCKEQSKKITRKEPPADKKNQLNTRTKYKPPLPGAKKLKSPIARSGMNRTLNKTDALSTQSPLRDNLDHSPSGALPAGRRQSLPQRQGKATNMVGPKARSSSLERPIGRKPPRNNSGDSLRRRNFSEDEYDYSSPGEDNGHDSSLSNGYYRNSPVLPHHKLKVVDGDRGSPLTRRTPTPPSSRKSSSDSVGRRPSKFCYECGTRYPVPHAKYCCECGTKRPYIE